MSNFDFNKKVETIMAGIASKSKYSRAAMLAIANELLVKFANEMNVLLTGQEKLNNDLKSLNKTLVNRISNLEKYYEKILKDNKYIIEQKDIKVRDAISQRDKVIEDFEAFKNAKKINLKERLKKCFPLLNKQKTGSTNSNEQL